MPTMWNPISLSNSIILLSIMTCNYLNNIIGFNIPTNHIRISSKRSKHQLHSTIANKKNYKTIPINNTKTEMNVLKYMNESEDTKLITDFKNSMIWESISEKVGKVSEERVAFPELVNGEVPRLFSNIRYDKKSDRTKVIHESGSIFGAASLVAGTTIGAGILGLPTATASIGFLPSVGGLVLAWVYMVISGLLIAELCINRIGETGRVGSGLLDLYKEILGDTGNAIGSSAYFFLHYAMMVAYIAQAGSNINAVLPSLPDGAGQVLFAGIMCSSIYLLKPTTIEKVNNVLVATLAIAFGSILTIGSQSADMSSLINLQNQHTENVVNAFPIFFLSLVYQNIVPTIVKQLEGDRNKITQAIIAGTFIPLLMFIAWNGVILGNIYNAPTDVMNQITSGVLDPIALLQSNGLPGSEALGTLVTIFSQLAVTTSLIGFVYGLNDAITDTFKLPKTIKSKNINYKPFIYSGIFLPPLLLSLYNPDIFYNALEYGGAFGVSTLFLILPPIMIWKKRYGEDMENQTITTLPMVPGGKLTLGSVWKAASTLIVEQIADKLGLIDYITHLLDKR